MRDTGTVTWDINSNVTHGNGAGVVQGATFDNVTVQCNTVSENCSNMIQIDIDTEAPSEPATAGLCNFGAWDDAGTVRLSIHCNGGTRIDF